MNDHESQREDFLYDVTLTGQVKQGFNQELVIIAIAKLFQLSENRVASLFNGQPSTLKRGLSHKAAFQYQQKLAELGAEVLLERRFIQQSAPAFSLVPEGEEQTSFEQLAQKLQKGAKIRCEHCGEIQPFAANCRTCGKTLKGILLEQSTGNLKLKQRILKRFSFAIGLLLVIFAIIDYLHIWPGIPPTQNIPWFDPLLLVAGIVLMVAAKGRKSPENT